MWSPVCSAVCSAVWAVYRITPCVITRLQGTTQNQMQSGVAITMWSFAGASCESCCTWLTAGYGEDGLW